MEGGDIATARVRCHKCGETTVVSFLAWLTTSAIVALLMDTICSHCGLKAGTRAPDKNP